MTTLDSKKVESKLFLLDFRFKKSQQKIFESTFFLTLRFDSVDSNLFPFSWFYFFRIEVESKKKNRNKNSIQKLVIFQSIHRKFVTSSRNGFSENPRSCPRRFHDFENFCVLFHVDCGRMNPKFSSVSWTADNHILGRMDGSERIFLVDGGKVYGPGKYTVSA